jgi:hypothetical protein
MSDDPILRNKERFNQEVEGIRNHPDLSDEAKQRYLSDAYEKAQAKHEELVTEHKASQQGAIRDLEKQVFKVDFPLSVSTQEKEMIRLSYRDAYDRAERVVAGKEGPERNQALKDLLERAERTGDAQQADAVYHLARERGIWAVCDAYLESRPKAKEVWEKYSAARQEAESLESRLFGFMPPRKPHELDRMPRDATGTGRDRIRAMYDGAAR